MENNQFDYSSTRSVYDCVHKLIEFDDIYWKFIDTPQYQRLRDLHQLGANHLVFPSASHSRFEHSLGTGHLCKEYINKLQINQNKYSNKNKNSLLISEYNFDEITEDTIQNVIIAGLCHNIGHGPYSYPFTDFIHETLQISDWDSKNSTLMLLEDIIDSNSIDISRENINQIKDIIVGENKFSFESEFEKKNILEKENNIKNKNISYPYWALQILHNTTNGVDIDKFDFIRRDTYKLGLPNQSFDGDILINNARIINNNICFREKDAFSIYEFFQCRYKLFKEFYLHRVSKGIDLMIKDIFTESNIVYNYAEYLNDPKMFIKLKDNILNDIYYSKNVNLNSSREIVKRIYKRNLYKFVGEKTCISGSTGNYEKFLHLTEQDIINCASGNGLDSNEEPLKLGDIKILKCKLDFCKGEEDPVEYVKFYSYDKSKSKINVKNINRSEISLLTPSYFKEFIFRVYVKDAVKLNAAKSAFYRFCNEKTGESPHHYEKKSANKLNFDK